MSLREFTVLMAGLPADSAFAAALADVPHTASDPASIAAAFGSYHG